MPPGGDIAARFAAALDADDFGAVRPLLGEECRYDVRGETLVGPDAILDSYRTASASARRAFDRVTYSSRVVRTDADSATVEFADHLERAGSTHTFRSLQHLTIVDGVIVAIRHEDLPGEREKLAAYRSGWAGEN
jgi:hypothetical protein